MRGLFTAGVMDVMMEAGVKFDGLIGVSAGATFGCNYKSRQPGRVLRYNLRFIGEPRYMSWRWSQRRLQLHSCSAFLSITEIKLFQYLKKQ